MNGCASAPPDAAGHIEKPLPVQNVPSDAAHAATRARSLPSDAGS